MLKPIDVIFKHPIKKFTVIYQNGQLWQLPRLEFDGESLQYKRPYLGSREDILVAHNQTLNPLDYVLISQLLTVHLPECVFDCDVNMFESWWQQHWYEYQNEINAKRKRQQHAKRMLERTYLTQPQPQPQPQPVNGFSTLLSSNSMDIFDAMLADLTKNIHKSHSR